jgi:hypothetical protein
MELNVHVSLLTNQIKLLAAICLTQSFIEQQLDNDEILGNMLKPTTYNKKSLLTKFLLDLADVK